MHEARYEPSADTTPSAAVIRAIAAAENVDPIELPPLTESIDPDAIDSLFDGRDDDAESNDMVLGFAVDGWNVFVRGDGHIRICDPEERAEATALSGTSEPARTD